MNIRLLQTSDEITFQEITALTQAVGWGECFYQTEAKWRRILDVSTHIAYARMDQKIIAFGRILEDGMMCMFYDVCVHPDHQRGKIGTSLMTCLIDQIKDKEFISIGLFVWEGNPSAENFYGQMGFQRVTAMELKMRMKKI